MVLWQLVASWGSGQRVCKVRGEKIEENADHLHSLYTTTLAPTTLALTPRSVII